MPQIPQFDAKDAGFRASETGVESVAGAARRVGMFYNQEATAEETLARSTERLGAQTAELGSEKANLLTGEGARLGSAVAAAGDAAVKYAEHQEVSHGSAAFAGLLQSATQDWNDRVKNADPNDTTIAPAFMAGLNDKFEQFQSAFNTEGGQQWAQEHVNALRQHFAEKTSADMSTMAGQAAVVNQQRTINMLSNTVHDDPSSIDFALAALKSSTEGMLSTSPNLTGPEAARARDEISQKGAEAIVKSAAIGYISKTGQVPPWAEDPKYSPYINGQELQLFAKQAQVQQRVDTATQKQTMVLQRQIDEQNVRAAANKNFADNVSFDQTTGQAVIKPEFFQNTLDIVRKYPNAPNAAETVKTYLDWAEGQQRLNEKPQRIATDRATASSLDDRMFAADNPTTVLDIRKAENEHKLSTQDAQLRVQLIEARDKQPIQDPTFKSAMAAAKELIEPKVNGVGLNSPEKYVGFMHNFMGQYLTLSREGKLPPNALDLNDPKSLISTTMQQYKPSLGDVISGNGGIGSPPATTAKESIISTKAEYDALKSGQAFTMNGKKYTKP